MKLFKKRQEKVLSNAFTDIQEPVQNTDVDHREELLNEYAELDLKYKLSQSEEVRLRMIEISEELSPKVLLQKEKKSFNIFKKKKKFEEKYCHTCKHNLSFHHRKGRSTGCRKCGCLRTVEEIMNPIDNGHDKLENIPEVKEYKSDV